MNSLQITSGPETVAQDMHHDLSSSLTVNNSESRNKKTSILNSINFQPNPAPQPHFHRGYWGRGQLTTRGGGACTITIHGQ